jgi:peptide/nickel transport system permease protein
MPFKPLVLPTDVLIYLLVLGVSVFAWYVRGREHLLVPWRRVGHSSSGMVSLTVLVFFVAVGLLDSVHYRPALPDEPGKPRAYAVEVLSLFDLIATPLRAKQERTYSAPFATRLYSRETVELPDGSVAREYPRLKYGGAALKDPATERGPDIARRTATGLAGAALAWAIATALLALSRSRRWAVPVREAWRRMWRGGTEVRWRAVFLTLALVFAVIGPAVTLSAQYHVFGTDKVGQDVLYLALKSIRTGLVIGTLTTMVMLPFALLLGIMAGYFKGWVDDAIQYLYTTLSSVPSVLLIAASVLMMQVYIENHPDLFDTVALRADMRLLFLCIILGITSWTGLCRLLRGEALKQRELEYIQAAHAFGVSHWRVITRHLLPNVMHIVLISVVMDFSGLVLAEAVLSYVGVGVDPTMISFGTMINAARLEMARDPVVWWSLAAAFAFMFLLVLAANLFADAVRDAFDPRVRVRAAPAAGFARHSERAA